MDRRDPTSASIAPSRHDLDCADAQGPAAEGQLTFALVLGPPEIRAAIRARLDLPSGVVLASASDYEAALALSRSPLLRQIIASDPVFGMSLAEFASRMRNRSITAPILRIDFD